MTGFLPAWLALGGVAVCGSCTWSTLAHCDPVPRWLLPAAFLLAAGTL